MANRSIDDLDNLWQRLRGIVAEYDVTVITATAPRQRRFMPQNENDVIIIDYIPLLNTGNNHAQKHDCS